MYIENTIIVLKYQFGCTKLSHDGTFGDIVCRQFVKKVSQVDDGNFKEFP